MKIYRLVQEEICASCKPGENHSVVDIGVFKSKKKAKRRKRKLERKGPPWDMGYRIYKEKVA